MNPIEEEILLELEADYEFESDRVRAIYELCKEAFSADLRDEIREEAVRQIQREQGVEETGTITLKEYSTTIPSHPYTTVTLGQYASGATNTSTFTASAVKQAVSNLRYGTRAYNSNAVVEITEQPDRLRQQVAYMCQCGWGGVATEMGDAELMKIRHEMYKQHAEKIHGLIDGNGLTITMYP